MKTRPISHQIRQARKNKGLTLEAAAEAVGVSDEIFERFESGKTRPSPMTIGKMVVLGWICEQPEA